MKRRTLDILFSVGGAGLAGLLLILGLVMTNRADFAKDYVRNQLTPQDIEFKKADELQPQETEFTKARSGCVIEYAGQAVTSGKQAECYANEYIGGHLTWLATRLEMPQVAYLDGMSFREIGLEQTRLKTEIAAAEESSDPALADLEQELKDVTTVRGKVFEGEMLRSALLTTFGFGKLGDTARQVATVAYLVAVLLLLLSIAGFVHAFVTPKSKAVGVPEPTNGKKAAKELAQV